MCQFRKWHNRAKCDWKSRAAITKINQCFTMAHWKLINVVWECAIQRMKWDWQADTSKTVDQVIQFKCCDEDTRIEMLNNMSLLIARSRLKWVFRNFVASLLLKLWHIIFSNYWNLVTAFRNYYVNNNVRYVELSVNSAAEFSTQINYNLVLWICDISRESRNSKGNFHFSLKINRKKKHFELRFLSSVKWIKAIDYLFSLASAVRCY